MVPALAQELRRLGKARSSSAGRRLARRVALLILIAFAVLVATHRLVGSVPGLSALEGRPLRAVLVVASVLVGALLVGRLAAAMKKPGRRDLARFVDDALGLSDATDAALSSSSAPTELQDLLETRAASRLSKVEPATLWPPDRGTRRALLWLAVATLLLFLAPGVLGIGGVRGAGRGTDLGAGRREAKSEDTGKHGLSPEDADRWLREHGHLTLDVPQPEKAWNAWVARLSTDLAPPEALRGEVFTFVDGRGPIGPVAALDLPPHVVASAPAEFRGDEDPRAKDLLRPGKHKVFVRFVPKGGPWKQALDSDEIEVEVPPPKDGGKDKNQPQPQPQPDPKAKPPPQPQPQPKPEPPPPTPPPPQPPPPTPPPPGPAPGPAPEAKFHDEVVDPLDKDGPKVKKDKAVVAVKDDDAGTAPREVPLAEALKDLDRVVERAISGEKVLQSDREFVRRYLEALRRASGAPSPR